MKIAAAQIKNFEQNIDANIENHMRMIDLAALQEVQLIAFPEMSRNDYQMELADAL